MRALVHAGLGFAAGVFLGFWSGFFVGGLIAGAARVSCLEGGCGTFVVSVALAGAGLGGLAGTIRAVVRASRPRRRHPDEIGLPFRRPPPVVRSFV